MSVFALPNVFRASALHADGDPWVSDGVHLRVRVWREIGFPLHPFAAWRIGDFGLRQIDVRWTDARGAPIAAPFDPEAVGGTAYGTLVGLSAAFPDPEWCWVSVDADGGDGFRVDVVDRWRLSTGADRVLATRRSSPYEFGGTAIARLRVSGPGEVRGVSGLHASQIPLGLLDTRPSFEFGLPLPIDHWYTGLPDPTSAAKERLYFGAPRQLGPPDRPDGPPFELLNPSDDVAHIFGSVAPALIDDWIEHAFGDPATPPLARIRTLSEPPAGRPAREARVGSVDALLTMAVDPSIARYLGLATALEPAAANVQLGPNVWIVASQWAVQLDRRLYPRFPFRLESWLSVGRPPRQLDSVLPDIQAIRQRIAALNQTVALPWQVVTLLAVAVAAGHAPPDPPDTPAPELREAGRWNPARRTPTQPNVALDDRTWMQGIRLTSQPAEGMVGFARLRPGPTTSLHARQPDGRAAALLPPYSSRREAVAGPGGATSRIRERTLADAEVAADPSGAAWRLWQADEFGRWSEPAEISGPEPERPLPRPPIPELTFWSAEPVAATDPRPPGRLQVRVPVPVASDLEPGSLPIASLALSSPDVVARRRGAQQIAGSNVSFAVTPGETIEIEATPRGFEVAEAATVAVTATFTDTAGRSSPSQRVERLLHDPRPVREIPTAPTVVWCSRPDGTGRSELAVRWSVRPGQAAFRVYLGDERRLAAALGIAVHEDEPRAVRARRIWLRSGDLASKGEFTLLTEQPLPAMGGEIRFRYQLPGTLRGVQFVRVVPLTAAGVETAFAACGLVPVAVPSSERPPAPTLRVSPAAAGGVTVRVEARGLRDDLLTALQAAGAIDRPQFRLRRTRRLETQSLYLPVIAFGELQRVGGVWQAELVDGAAPPLPAFVRHTWVVEVRYPREPSLAPGAVAVDDPQQVRPAWESSVGPAEMGWSAASLPASTLLAPPAPPEPPEDVSFRVQAGRATLTIPTPPVAHPAALGPYRVLIYREVAGQPLQALPAQDLLTAPFVFVDPTPADGYRVLYVDPLGQLGQPTAAVHW